MSSYLLDTTLAFATDREKSSKMSRRSENIVKQAHARIAAIRDSLNTVDYLCSGTLLEHRTRCGKPGCRCANDPNARHGPYYDWGHMQAGKLVHRRVSPEQAVVLRLAIANYRKIKKLLLAWEKETERLIDAENQQNP
jgi:hypothetical protein